MRNVVVGEHDLVLGFDPGGGRCFGVALLTGTDFVAATVGCVAEAAEWAFAQCGRRIPIAAGIDTLLHWSDGPSGWRRADKLLRTAYPQARSSILSPNGLFGSMAIGGMALALRLRDRWPSILLNETHPKVLYHSLAGQRYRPSEIGVAIEWFVERTRLSGTPVRDEHELDALISAWATWTGLSEEWCDLVGQDHDRLIFPAGHVRYLWPTRLA